MSVALTLALTAVLLIVEWKQDADRFLGSLPVSRKDVVSARYAWVLGAAAVGTVLYAFYGRLLLELATERWLPRWSGAPGWGSAAGLVTFFVTAWLVSVAYLPFYFRSGLAKGTWLFAAAAAMSIVGGVLLTRRWPVHWTLIGISESAGSVATVVAALLVALALGWLSLRLSIRFYDRRDL